jgi:hypothetical protein
MSKREALVVGFADVGPDHKRTSGVSELPMNADSAPAAPPHQTPAGGAAGVSVSANVTVSAIVSVSANGGRWTPEEDTLLRDAVEEIGAKNWKLISNKYFQGQRDSVQCLHRWQKVLAPGLVKGW